MYLWKCCEVFHSSHSRVTHHKLPVRSKEDGWLLFVQQCLLILTCLCIGYTNTAPGGMRKPDVFFPAFILVLPRGVLPDMDARVCKQTWAKMHTLVFAFTCVHPCALMNRWAYTYAGRQMFIHKQTLTLTGKTSFLVTQWVVGEFVRVKVPLQLPLRMWQRLTIFLWTHKDNVSMSSY